MEKPNFENQSESPFRYGTIGAKREAIRRNPERQAAQDNVLADLTSERRKQDNRKRESILRKIFGNNKK